VNELNSLILEGHLATDVLFRVTPMGSKVASFTVANLRNYRSGGKTKIEESRFEVEVWSELAESCNRLGHKGRGVRIVGRIKQDRWADGDGNPRSRVVVVADHVEFRPESYSQDTTYAGDHIVEETVPVEGVAESSV
jgi:single-strand DNA-binding protein